MKLKKILDLLLMFPIEVYIIILLLNWTIKISVQTELKKFNKLYDDYNLMDEGWEKFNCHIEKAPSWSKFEFGLIGSSKRVNFF